MHTIKKHLPNKYGLVAIGFGIFICFFDGNSMLKRYHTRKQINAIEKEIKQYDERIARDQAEIKAMEDDLKNLERFAREFYHMKKPNEDVFIIRE